MTKLGKRMTNAKETVDRDKQYGLDEAVSLVKNNAGAKFDETVEIAVNLATGTASTFTRPKLRSAQL